MHLIFFSLLYRTVLMSGSPVNVTWHLGYPHGGGYRVELTCPSTVSTLKCMNVSWTPSGWGIHGNTYLP